MKPPVPSDEAQRLAALREYGILDSPPEAAFDDLTQLASQICDAPIALITLVDSERQWFKSRVGMDLTGTDRDASFCAHAILDSDIFVVPDAATDARFADNAPFVHELGVRFYAGAPLLAPNGSALGTLCVMDRVPRELTAGQARSLRALARQAMAQLELRRHNARLEALLGERLETERALERRAERALRQQAVLVRLARMDKSDFCHALQEITRADAETLGVERVSIWFFDRSGTRIVCEDLFKRTSAQHSRGARIEAERVPRYFAALREQRVIAAADARNDPRTSDFADEYLVPLGITSMLDVPIWRDGEVVGIVCHEHTGPLREWEPWEQDFAASIADMVAVTVETNSRRRAENELRAREQQLATAQRLAALGSWRWDAAGDRLNWSDELLRICGLEPDAHGSTLDAHFERVHPEDRERVRREVQQAMQTGQPFDFEHRVVRPDGDVRMLHCVGEPTRTAEGRVVRLVGACHDITERTRAEAELEASRADLEQRVAERTAELARANLALQGEVVERARAERELLRRTCEMQAIFAAFPDLYFRLDQAGVILEHHAGQESNLNVPAEEFLNRPIAELLPPAVAQPLALALERASTAKLPTAFEYTLAVGGDALAFEARLLPLPDDQIIAIVRDITHRKRAEDALKRSEEHFRLLIENSSDIATVVDATATVLYASPSIERVLGYEPQDVLGMDAFKMVHPEDLPGTRGALQYLIEHPGKELSVEYRVRSGDGSWRVLEGIARTLMPDSAAAGVVINARDITERKQAAEELRLRKILLEAQGEASFDGILVISEEGAIVSYNRRFAEMWDIPQDVLDAGRDELALKAVIDKVSDPEGFLARVAHLYAVPSETSQDEIELRDGRVFDRRSGPVSSGDGRYYGRIWFFRDVTERRLAEQKLRRREEYFRSLIENGGDIIGIIDGAGIIRYDSPSVERVLGYPPAELVGRSVFDYLHPDDVASTREMLENVLVEPGAGVPVEFHFRHADGTHRLLEAVGKPLVLDGQLEGVVVNARDVTQRKRQEEALQRAIHAAEEARETADRANRAKSEFLSRMSHELRTPMNSILGFAQLMAKKELPADQRRGTDHILKAGRHLLNLINEVLDIARIESNRQQFSIEPVRARALLQETLNLIRPLAAQHAVRVDGSIVMDAEYYVSADRQRLTQVMLNLLSNAVKYNRPGGVVSVSCVKVNGAEGSERLRMRVHDTGYGITAEKLDRLFTPFERLGAEQSEVEGTGLGLALSKRLVEAMGGGLSVETTAGVGCTFTVELPVVENPVDRLVQDGGRRAMRETAGAGRTATVLYIEDNLANLSLIETILAGRPEITLMSALQGQLGIELAWQHGPDLILLDLHLPDISGDEVLRKLRGDERTRRTPVMVISADATSGRTQRLMEAGADAYMTKPLDVDDFLDTVDRLLAGEAETGG